MESYRDKPSAKSSYLFSKKMTHFRAEVKQVAVPDESSHHRIVEMRKTFKESGSDSRNNGTWIAIANDNIKSARRSRINRIMILGGELFRFLDINELPKYRALAAEEKEGETAEKEKEGIVSKKIEGTEFFTYIQRKIESKKIKYITEKKYRELTLANDPLASDYIRVEWKPKHFAMAIYLDHDFNQGAGRANMGNLYYANDDFHFGNGFVDQNEYFKPIDFDRLFSKTSLAFHKDAIWRSNPILTLADWNSLPILTDHKPSKWQWNDQAMRPYSFKLSKDAEFLAEKYLSTLKLITTFGLQKKLIQYHVEDQKDQKEILDFTSDQCSTLIEICRQSKEFKEYITLQGKKALAAILFEVNEFYKNNQHYGVDAMQSNAIWQDHLSSVIKAFKQFLSVLKMDILEKDINFLYEFLKDLSVGKESAFVLVKEFYSKNQMQAYVSIVERVMSSLVLDHPKKQKRISIFNESKKMQKTDSDVRVEKLQDQENISKGEEQTKDKEPESISKSLGVGVCYQRL